MTALAINLIVISLLWYVSKSIIVSSKANDNKSVIFLILYSIYIVGIIIAYLWNYKVDGNNYNFVLVVYALIVLMSIWIFKIFIANKPN